MKLRTPSNTWMPSGSGRRGQPIFRSTIESMAAHHDTERSGCRKSLATPTGVCERLRPTTTVIAMPRMANRANRRLSMSYLRSKLGFSLSMFTDKIYPTAIQLSMFPRFFAPQPVILDILANMYQIDTLYTVKATTQSDKLVRDLNL